MLPTLWEDPRTESRFPIEEASMVAHHIQLNARTVDEPGYWIDRHGHSVFRCVGQLLPSCPQQPFGTTRWRLARPLPCVNRKPGLRDAA